MLHRAVPEQTRPWESAGGGWVAGDTQSWEGPGVLLFALWVSEHTPRVLLAAGVLHSFAMMEGLR